MERLHLVYAAFGTLAVLLALVSRDVRRLPVSEPLLALLLGVALGPQVAGLLHFSEAIRDPLLLEGSRLLLAASVMAAALRFPATSLRALLLPVVLLLIVVMPLSAAVSGAASLLLGLPMALAALVGACLCPTDPVLAAGTIIGIAAGVLAGLALRAATRDEDLEKGPKLVFSLLLAVAVLGVARLAATDGVLAVFVAGLAYNRILGRDERGEQEGIDEAVNRYAVLPLFVVLGSVLPWQEWATFGPAALLFVGAVLVLRRLPLLLLLARPLGLGPREATFVGWFGPMGVSAIFYLAHSIDEGVTDPRLFAAGSLVVAASVAAFGFTATPGRKIYAHP